MVATYANVSPAPLKDGSPYCRGVVIPAAEGDLYNVSPPHPMGAPPICEPYGQCVIASVELSTTALVTSETSYVILQGDQGDGVWFDLAWLNWSGKGQANFLLFAGNYTSGAVQQTRPAGTAPSPSLGSIQCPLTGRFRFVGKATVNAGVAGGASSSSSSARASSSSARASSSSGRASVGPAPVAAVLATIIFKVLGLR